MGLRFEVTKYSRGLDELGTSVSLRDRLSNLTSDKN